LQANLFIIRAFGGMVKLLEPPPPTRMDGSCRHLRIEFVVYQIESKAGMELFLNLAWVLVTAAMAVLWLRFGLREGIDRRTQAVALVVLILILLPVFSPESRRSRLLLEARRHCAGRAFYVPRNRRSDAAADCRSASRGFAASRSQR
jgi:hypothetical protein